MTTLCRRIGWIGLLLSVAQAAAATESPAIHASMQRDIVLVRHGHYAPDPAADPELGPGLSTLGIAQAELLGSQLAIMPRFAARPARSETLRSIWRSQSIVEAPAYCPVQWLHLAVLDRVVGN